MSDLSPKQSSQLTSAAAWIVRVAGGTFAILDIVGFVNALMTIMSGKSDIQRLVYSAVVIILLPVLLNMTAYKVDNETTAKLIIHSAYAILLSLLMCGTYLIVGAMVIDSPMVIFGFLDRPILTFNDWIPASVITLLFLSSVILYGHYLSRVPTFIFVVASLPVLCVFGWILLRYVAFQELFSLLDTAKKSGIPGWVALSYLVIATGLFLSQGLRLLTEKDFRAPFEKVNAARS